MSEQGRARRPNVVLIVADDLGFGDLSCYNPESRIPTPNIDSLARRGARWTDMHTPSAVCTPSRYGMLTGRYAWRSRLPYGVLYGYEPPLIAADLPTLPGMLRDRGYHTACVGKWHLGMNFRPKSGQHIDLESPLPWKSEDFALEQKIDFGAPVTGGPIERGFDSFFGTAGCPTAQPPFAFISQDRFVEAPTEFRDRIHFTGRGGMHSPSWQHRDADPTFTREAVSRIRNLADGAQPFFLYLAASAPHEPCLALTVPEFAQGQSKAGHRGDLVWLFDWMVGQVLEALRETGAAQNTVVIVTSDNGALPGDRVSASEGMDGYRLYGHASCGSFRGYKAHIWEGGHRVPFVVAPAQAGPGNAPAIVEQSACLTDLFATLDVLTRPVHADPVATPGSSQGSRARPEDSADLSGYPGFREWLGPNPRPPGTEAQRRVLVHHSGFGVFALRVGDSKLISESGGSGGWPPPAGTFPSPGSDGQLYNLAEDPGELENLYHRRGDLIREYQELIQKFRAGRPTVSAEL